MNEILEFLNQEYKTAIQLSNSFHDTRSFEWTPLLILNELAVQLGHIYNIIYQSVAVNEENRFFSNLGDELSDVLLQLIALADSMNINLYNIVNLKNIKEDNWFSLPILFGQLNEAVMEKYGYRFAKPRMGFETIEEFIENRILRLFDVTFQISLKYQLDPIQEFNNMVEDATGFLKKYKTKKSNKHLTEII